MYFDIKKPFYIRILVRFYFRLYLNRAAAGCNFFLQMLQSGNLWMRGCSTCPPTTTTDTEHGGRKRGLYQFLEHLKNCVFNAQSRFASDDLDGVLGPPRLVRHTYLGPCISVVPNAMHEVSRGTLKGAAPCQLKKSFKGLRRRWGIFWEEQKRTVFPSQGVIPLPFRKIADNFPVWREPGFRNLGFRVLPWLRALSIGTLEFQLEELCGI